MTGHFNLIRRHPLRSFLVFVLTVTWLRIGGLFLSEVNLGPDETQYWHWSLNPAFGYFSKPPMIAWLIHASTTLFGHAEWAVRLFSPMLHAGSAIWLYLAAAFCFGRRAALWAGTGWLLIPGVAFSSALFTTDVPLLFFWSGALFLWLRLVIIKPGQYGEVSFGLGLTLGLMLGAGFLSKYAMIYFTLAMVGSLFAIPALRHTRAMIGSTIALAVMALVALPNILWNVKNGLQTVEHTAANAAWDRSLFNPGAFFEFFFAQFGVFGPVLFAGFILFLGLRLRHRFGRDQLFAGIKPAAPVRRPVRNATATLIWFALTPLVIVCIQAFISRAHANWAAAAYPAMTLLATVWLLRWRRGIALKINHALTGTLSLALAIGLLSFPLIDYLGLSDAIKRVRGWPEQGAFVAFHAQDYPTIMADDRELTGELLYYADLSGRGVVAFNSNSRIDSTYEANNPYTGGQAEPILFVSLERDAPGTKTVFETVSLIATNTVERGKSPPRTLYLYRLEGFRFTD